MGMVFAVLFKVKTSISIKDGELDKEVLFPIGSIYTHPQGISLPPPREPSFGQAATGALQVVRGLLACCPAPVQPLYIASDFLLLVLAHQVAEG